MKKCTQRLIRLMAMIAIVILSTPMLSIAQDPGDDPDAPLDGGTGILIAAGVGYGIKKMKEARKKKSEQE